jgi:hypothetical protein
MASGLWRSDSLYTVVTSSPAARRSAAVPFVATSWNPSAGSFLMASMTRGRSSRETDTKTVPSVGSELPAASIALAYANGYVMSMPMTSPVLFISGPSTESTPGSLRKGNTGALTATCRMAGRSTLRSFSLRPMATLAAILAIGMPVAFAT